MSSEKQFTIEELKDYNGKDGKPAYIAYKGKVYDVTDDYLWAHGEHQDEHSAGTDLTEKMSLAPHMEDVLERVKAVGLLKKWKRQTQTSPYNLNVHCHCYLGLLNTFLNRNINRNSPRKLFWARK